MRRPNGPGRPAASPPGRDTPKSPASQKRRAESPTKKTSEPRRKTSLRVAAKNQEAAEAKRKLKEAVKARKAFERDEVRRFTAHLRRRRITLASIFGSLAAILLFVAVGVFSPLLSLQVISVEGAARVPAQQIIDELQPQLNKPLPLVDMAAVRQAVEKQPLVKSYSTVAIPPHTLVIKLVERQPIAALAEAGRYTLVDPAGVVIEKVDEPPAGVPVLDLEENSVDSVGFAAAVDVLLSLPAELGGQVQEVIAKTTDDVTLVLSGGARVFWGGPENSDFKHYVLSKLLAVNPVGSVSEYDVSSPNTAVVR